MSNIQTMPPIVAKPGASKSLALSLFEYIVAKLIGADQIPPKSIKQCNDELREYSMTRYMKTLYFLCLTSCTILQEKDDEQRESKGIPPVGNLYTRSLFNSFSFTTYPNGPVAHEVYGTLRGEFAMPADMLFKVGRELSLNDGSSLTAVRDSVKEFETDHAYEAELALVSLERLFGGEYTPLGDRKETGLRGIKYKEIDTQMLIDVSHSFPSWIVATQGIEEELYALKGVRPVFDFIDKQNIKGNISALLKDEDLLKAELQAFNKFRRKNNQESN